MSCAIRSRLDGLIAMYDSLNGADLTDAEARCANELERMEGSFEILLQQDKEKYQKQASVLLYRMRETQKIEHLQKRLYEVERRTRDAKLDSQNYNMKISEAEGTLKRLQNARQQQAQQLNHLTQTVMRERDNNRALNEKLTMELGRARAEAEAEAARSKLLHNQVSAARAEAEAELKRLRVEYSEATAGVRAAQAEQRSMAVRLGGLRYELAHAQPSENRQKIIQDSIENI